MSVLAGDEDDAAAQACDLVENIVGQHDRFDSYDVSTTGQVSAGGVLADDDAVRGTRP